MPSGVRANSLLVVATPSVLVRSLDEAVEYLDRHGVPRRRVGNADARRLVLRGSSLSSLDTVRAIYDQQDLHQDDDREQYEEAEEVNNEDETNQDDVYSSSKRLEEKLALERARQAKMERRKQMICEIRDRKRQLLITQHENILECVQLWNDVLKHDPEAELTSAHTALSPSSKARAYVDEDGNVRRKSIDETETPMTSPDAKATATTGFASFAGVCALIARKSFVLEFVQTILED